MSNFSFCNCNLPVRYLSHFTHIFLSPSTLSSIDFFNFTQSSTLVPDMAFIEKIMYFFHFYSPIISFWSNLKLRSIQWPNHVFFSESQEAGKKTKKHMQPYILVTIQLYALNFSWDFGMVCLLCQSIFYTLLKSLCHHLTSTLT